MLLLIEKILLAADWLLLLQKQHNQVQCLEMESKDIWGAPNKTSSKQTENTAKFVKTSTSHEDESPSVQVTTSSLPFKQNQMLDDKNVLQFIIPRRYI